MPAACAAVRDQLAELSVGVLSEAERRDVEAHLEWCAACRKEAGELAGAAATLAFSLEPARVPEGLLERVLPQMARAARAPAFRRRTRTAASVAVAAMVAVSALGWGAVMAGRAQRFEVLARSEAERRTSALRQFQTVFRGFQHRLGTGLPTDDTRLIRLAPTGAGSGGGAALELVAQGMLDFVVVHVSGLPAEGRSLPYSVWLVDGAGNSVLAGRLSTLDADGAGDVFRQFNDTDLSPFATVVVRDAAGHVALRGSADAAVGG